MGDWPVTINPTDDTIAEWQALITAYTSRTNKNLAMWWVVWSPYLTDSFYIVAEPPKELPMSEMSQNELQTVEIGLSINEYKGMAAAIRPTESGGGGTP